MSFSSYLKKNPGEQIADLGPEPKPTLNMSGLFLWLDAQDHNTVIASGSHYGESASLGLKTQEWRDKSGKNHHVLMRFHGGCMPTYSASAMNGYNAVAFNANSVDLNPPSTNYDLGNWMEALNYKYSGGTQFSDMPTTDQFTIAAVFQVTGSGAAYSNSGASKALNTPNVRYLFYDNNANFALGFAANNTLEFRQYNNINNGSATNFTTGSHLAIFTHDNGAYNLYMDGSGSTEIAVSGLPLAWSGGGGANHDRDQYSDRITIGCGSQPRYDFHAYTLRNASPSQRFFDGYIGEIIMFDRLFSTREQSDLAKILMNKWGIT